MAHSMNRGEAKQRRDERQRREAEALQRRKAETRGRNERQRKCRDERQRREAETKEQTQRKNPAELRAVNVEMRELELAGEARSYIL